MNATTQTARPTVPVGWSSAYYRALTQGPESLKLFFDTVGMNQSAPASPAPRRLASPVDARISATCFRAPNGLRLVFGSNVPPRRRELQDAGYRLLT